MQYLNFKCLKKVVYLCMWRKIALTERPGNGVHHRQIIGLSIPVIPRKCWPDAITWFDSAIFYFYRRFHLCCFYFRTKLWNPIAHWQWQDCGTQEDPITFMVTIDLLGGRNGSKANWLAVRGNLNQGAMYKTNDVISIFGIFDPLSPRSVIFFTIAITQPPLLWSFFGEPPHRWRDLYMAPNNMMAMMVM